jgi:tRNA(fMet)-specific endonuclease VapC
VNEPVLDSDVMIDYLRGRGPGHQLLVALRGHLAFRITAVTALELALGRSYARDPRPVDALLAAPCLSLGRASGIRAGALIRELRAAGETIDVRDAMQAAICVEHDAPLVTRNVRHLGRVGGLNVLSTDRALVVFGRS